MQPCVYIMASRSRVLYVGVTRDLRRRWEQHHAGMGSEFVAKYRVHRLVHVELTDRLLDALRREHQIKGWRRSKKVALIEATNPEWEDLAQRWGWR
jgi:putative endonuclease